jgi:hypothetical protein
VTGRRNLFIVLGAVLLIAAVAGVWMFAAGGGGETALTVNGTLHKTFTEQQVRALPSITGHGGSVSTTGIKSGPFTIKGVPLTTLCEAAGGMQQNQTLRVSAPDGYMWVFDFNQTHGKGFITFSPDLKEIPSPNLVPVLMYEQDGQPLTQEQGGPFRIAILTQDDVQVVTEGSDWVKWVNTLEIWS